MLNLNSPIFVEVHAITRVPNANALLYLPTEDDIKQLASNPESQPFWHTLLKDEFTLHEEAMR